MLEQTIWLTPRATAFTAVCEACAAEHGYHAAHLAGRLALDRDHGSALCPRGHHIRVERANREPIGVVPHAA
jgi:hypothetical protein